MTVKLTDSQRRIYNDINVQDLILVVKEIPIIWDTSDEKYKSYEWKDLYMWPKVAFQLGLTNLPNNDVVIALKARWRNLKTQYGQQLNKQKKSDSASEDCKIRWQHFHTLSFLRKTMKNNRNTNSNLEIPTSTPLKRSTTNFENTEKSKKIAEIDEEQDEDRKTFIDMVNTLLPMVKTMDTLSKEDYFQELYNFTKTFYRQRCLNMDCQIVYNIINIDDF